MKHSLRTASLELSLERSKHSVEIVAKDEDIRKLQVSQCLLQNEASDLHEQLESEQERSEGLDAELSETLAQLDEQIAAAELAQNQIRMQGREVANLKVCFPNNLAVRLLTCNKAELKAMENVTSDSNKLLSEKLALTRELSSLRPEVEHLRAQVETNNGLLAEKLSLQRQLNTAQVELENEKRTSARALAKQGKKIEEDEGLRALVEELRNELAAEKKNRIKAEAALAKAEKATEKVQADLDAQQQAVERAQAKLDKQGKKASLRDEERDAEIERLGQELASEKRARLAAEKASTQNSERDAQVEELQEQLSEEKRQREKLEKANKKASQQSNDKNDSEANDLKKELELEKRERKKQEKEHAKTLAELQARNTILDDKLSAFREKLRSTKAALKQKEEELEHAARAQTAPPTKPIRETSLKPAKGIRKRLAASVEPETALGTPGHDVPSKKTKRGTSVIGDTSNFSLTPFLKRTVAPGEPTIMEEPSDDEAAPTTTTSAAAAVAAQHAVATPTAPPKEKERPRPKPKALAPSASNKANAKPGTRKKTPAPILDVLAEETSQLSSRSNSENIPAPAPAAAPAPTTIPLKTSDGPSISTKPKTGLVPKIKPRKSLMSFATFTDDPVETKTKRKRKLGAASGLGKTLFDDEEEGEGEIGRAHV